MTTTYEPQHPRYRDEADVRQELSRVFDVCQACRQCIDHCSVFPTLFELLEQFDDRDAGRLTPAQQDHVVGECFHCSRCAFDCPYLPGVHESAVDVPRLMLRAEAMRAANGHLPARTRRANRSTRRTELVGKLATTTSPIANRVLGAKARSSLRRIVATFTGVSSVRLLPTFTTQRFSAWFAQRPKVSLTRRRASVTVFPTCLVEYCDPAIGHDLVKVYEHNGIECELTSARCCGAPWLHSGDVERFTEIAEQNVQRLAAEIRRGTVVVVPQPTCGYVLRQHYPDHVGGADADLVAAHTYDAAEYLMALHVADDTSLAVDFDGEVPEQIVYHAPCHLRAQGIGLTSRDLLALTGARVAIVQQCSGTDGLWGLRAGNEPIALPIAERLGERVETVGPGVVAGDCHLANTAIREQTGRRPLHPLQVLARAYGIPEEPR